MTDAAKLMHMDLQFQAMALDMPHIVGGHPNRLNFTGILTRVGTPSDAAPSGSGGKRILITHAAAEKALPSLLGMGINIAETADTHSPADKIGVITEAHLEGDAVHIAGVIYSSDSPLQAQKILADQAQLGFSFEARNIAVEDTDADPLVIQELCFTGASVLLKSAAAYRQTRISAMQAMAAIEKETIDMTPEEMKAQLTEVMAGAMQPVHTAIGELKNGLAAQSEQVNVLREALEANAVTMNKVRPLSEKLEKHAADMEASGIGLDPTNGHVAHLRRMAQDLNAQAALGRMPSAFNAGMGYYASADRAAQPVVQPVQVAPVAPVAVAPKIEESPAFQAMMASVEAMKATLEAKLAAAEDRAASLETKLTDVQASAKRDIAPPQRQTLSPHLQRLLAKEGIGEPGSDGQPMKLSASKVNTMLSGLSVSDKIKLKGQMANEGLIDPTGAF